MRLLNTSTIKLEELPYDDIPFYAILSHRWEKEEVLFHDLKDLSAAESMAGYKKIVGCCAQAASDGLEYVWIDTCCIDKTSSAELSEAINSMYRWYENAHVCYAYLADVPSASQVQLEKSFFSSSKWFTRGWTLQELLAPQTVVFYDPKWIEIGTKSSLQNEISVATGIDPAALLGIAEEEISVAKRMSWASKRETTRVEDMAYCLMGLFGVNMPLLYGEGKHAFIRLQHEIMRFSTDHTLFAWTLGPEERNPGATGMLASSPAAFADSGEFRRSENNTQMSSYSMTNVGLRIPLSLHSLRSKKKRLVALLDCQTPSGNGLVGIYLEQEKGGRCYSGAAQVLFFKGLEAYLLKAKLKKYL